MSPFASWTQSSRRPPTAPDRSTETACTHTHLDPIHPNYHDPPDPCPFTAANWAAAHDFIVRASVSDANNLEPLRHHVYRIVTGTATEPANFRADEAQPRWQYWRTRLFSFYRYVEMTALASGAPLDGHGVFRPACLAEAWRYRKTLVLQSQAMSLRSMEGRCSVDRLLERLRRHEGPGLYELTIIGADGRAATMGLYGFAGMPV